MNRTLTVRLEAKKELSHFWRRLINLGYAADLRAQDLDAALDRFSGELGFTHARICRITDLVTEGHSLGRSFYDFSAVFSLLDTLVARRITPFLELGNKSFAIQETTEISLNPVSPTATKDYYRHLLALLPHFMRACINHYGQEQVDGWYFEISYMYTNDGEREHFGLVQYVRAFRRIYQEIRALSASCRIGGPGFNDWSDPRQIRQMVQLITSQGVTPDFFSAYSYPVEVSRDGRAVLSENEHLTADRIRLFATTVREMLPESEIWITEFNTNLSSRNFLNDSVCQAAAIVRLILAVRDLKIRALAYYLLSDTPLRYLDSLDFLFGGWGLLTDTGIPKPSYHAYRLLSMLGHYRIRSGDSFLVSGNSAGSFQILFLNCVRLTDRFLRDNISRDDLLTPERVFFPLQEASFRIRIEGAQKGTYLMKEYRIDPSHANLFAVWKNCGFLNPPGRQTLVEMELSSSLIPDMRMQKLSEKEPFIIERTLRGNELLLITMELCSSRTDPDESI